MAAATDVWSFSVSLLRESAADFGLYLGTKADITVSSLFVYVCVFRFIKLSGHIP